MVVGRGGEDIKKLEEELTKKYGKKVRCSIIEIKNPDTNATLVAENIAAQLEKRIGFRRAMKQSMGRAMRMGAKGIKVSCAGRLGGAEIARTEHYHEGTIPLQTLRADIDFGFAEAATTYGRIGVKVWIYKGEVLHGGPRLGRSIEAPKPLSSAASVAVAVMTAVAAAVISIAVSVAHPARKEATANAAPQES